MDTGSRLHRIRAALLFRRDLLDGEHTDRALREAVLGGAAARVIRGCYMDRAIWDGLPPDEQLLARTLAVAHLQRPHSPLFSHLSAAAIWGLPIYGLRDGAAERVHVLRSPTAPGRSSASVLRHSGEWSDGDVAVVEGLRVTSLPRTIMDIARRYSAETAVGCADAGLRLILGSRGRPTEVEAWREGQLELLETMRGRPGVGAARRVLKLADPRADSPAESVSRLQLVRLDVPHEIQVHVAGADGRNYWMDFEFLAQGAFGEVDGRIKYTDPEYMAGRTPEQVLLDEKEREDQVRGVTGNRTVRWGWRHIGTARRLGSRLQGFGIEVPRLR